MLCFYVLAMCFSKQFRGNKFFFKKIFEKRVYFYLATGINKCKTYKNTLHIIHCR